LSAVLDKIDNAHIQWLKEEPARAKNAVPNPLEGYTVESKICTECGYSEGSTSNLFNCLTIAIPATVNNSRDLPLAWLLMNHFQSEVLEGVRCTYCSMQNLAATLGQEHPDVEKELLNKIEDARQDPKVMDELAKTYKLEEWKHGKSILRSKKKVISIAVPPEALILHINRTSWTARGSKKLWNDIKHPKILDIKGWCTEPPLDLKEKFRNRSTSTKYRIKAIVEHFGVDGHGHYICHRTWGVPRSRAEPDPWFSMDDETAEVLPQRKLDGKFSSFLVVYEQMPLPGSASNFESRKRPREFSSDSPNLLLQPPTKRRLLTKFWDKSKDDDGEIPRASEPKTANSLPLTNGNLPKVNGVEEPKINGIEGPKLNGIAEPKDGSISPLSNGVHNLKPEAIPAIEGEESEDAETGDETSRATTVEPGTQSSQNPPHGQGNKRKNKKKKKGKKGKKRQ